MTTASARSSAFLEAMGAGVAVVAAGGEDGATAIALPTVASYSIDPPSVMMSLPADAGELLDSTLGVSLLAAEQSDLAAELWRQLDRRGDLVMRDGVPLVPEALAHLSCRPSLVIEAGSGYLVVAEVTEVTIRPAAPLVFQDGVFYG